MKIRRAGKADYNAVMELYNGLVGEDRYSGHDQDSYHLVLDSLQHGIFVADDDGRIVGVASVSIRQIVRYTRPVAELDELYVDPEARSHGIGRALMEIVEDFSREHDCYRLYIESAYQHDEGHKFYEHLGYKNSGYQFM